MTPNELYETEATVERRTQSAAGNMYDDLMNGTFYEKQECAIRSMGGKPKYINQKDKENDNK